jgi:tRNA A-37 threonylcarbamoyl transferase component Bud32
MRSVNQIDDFETAATTNDELPPGTLLASGAYTILEHLKTGGFGITYLATDTLNRRVVVKECFPGGMCMRASRMVQVRSRTHALQVSSLISKFVVEAQSLAKVSHPNVVKVHQVFKENDTAYMALDYVEGHDLFELMEDSSLALTPAGVRSTLLKLLDAIAAVHEKGLLHRDISPDNILVDSKRNPILIDFGAVREQDRTSDSVASTLHVVKDGYSPQELYIAGGGDQGPWSDLYSLAASFYHVISGEAPANSQARLAALASNTPDPCVPLAGRFEGYDAAFLTAIDKAMSVLPKDRMQSARQWTLALNDAGDSKVHRLPVVEKTRTVTPMTRVTRMEADAARKKIGPAVLIGGVAAIALVSVGVYLAMPSSKTATVARVPADAALIASLESQVGKDAPAPAKAAPAATAATEPAPVVPEVEATTAAARPATTETAVPADVSALTSNWTIDLPFSASEGEPGLIAWTSGEVPDWVVRGVRVIAVNGTKVERIDEIPGLLRQSVDPGQAPFVTATLLTIPEGGSEPVEKTIDLPVVHRVVLINGAQFIVQWKDGAWRTEVQALPSDYNGEMRVGDIIVGHVTSGTRLDTPDALKNMLEAAIIAGEGSTTLAVQQGGQMWVVRFLLPQ